MIVNFFIGFGLIKDVLLERIELEHLFCCPSFSVNGWFLISKLYKVLKLMNIFMR